MVGPSKICLGLLQIHMVRIPDPWRKMSRYQELCFYIKQVIYAIQWYCEFPLDLSPCTFLSEGVMVALALIIFNVNIHPGGKPLIKPLLCSEGSSKSNRISTLELGADLKFSQPLYFFLTIWVRVMDVQLSCYLVLLSSDLTAHL